MDLSPEVNAWFRANQRDLPWRRAGFGAWGILVSEMMLQQTPVSRVIPRLKEWLDRWPTPADLAAAPAGDAVRAWQRLGYPRRALALHTSAALIVERHGGIVPRSVPDLLALPGVGDYTARAVAVFAYGDRHPVVDTNVRRVVARALHGGALAPPASTRRNLDAMEVLLPENDEDARTFNAAMMELGAVVCTARAPRCGVCPIMERCRWATLGYPPYSGARALPQKPYEGSDRQVRGLILAQLRASDIPVTQEDLERNKIDPVQLQRALVGLMIDGLTIAVDGGFSLP